MEENTQESNKTKTLYRVAAGVVAAVVIAAVIFLFPDNKDSNVQTAGISVPSATEIVDSFTNKDAVKDNNDLADNTAVAETPEVVEQENNVEKESKIQSSKSTTQIILEEEAKTFNSNPAKYYHIIIGSVETNDYANKVASKMAKENDITASVLDCGERFRIVNKTFTSKTNAVAYCNAFRAENEKFKDAWIYVEKNR